MRKQLNELSDDSSDRCWKNSAVFAEYRDAIEDISELGEVRKGERTFLQSYLLTFSKSVSHRT